ncbi:prophage regulatory protein [Variovorax boronicumulans]|uniref:helix-turn-helix transcriptional regulator n=1 Tax=Variovorax boronicumulans TaxID=436515 RepID=UPI002476A452|nr:AlpA family phage regulatory protein [Variovorax boronicumulans]MDH6169998.1 prophage regulatory protein [Variovorax boronicumulans]
MQLEHHVNARELVPQTVGAPAFFRMSDVIRITALSRATVYRRIAEGKFPPPIHIGVRTCRWPRAALQQWIEDPESYSNAPLSQKP